MRGGFIHNDLMVTKLQEAFQGIGATTAREVMIRSGSMLGYGDLIAELNGKRFLIEVERSARRASRDLLKAMALAVDELWIVVPTGRELHAVRRKLVRLGVRVPQPGIYLLTYGAALSRVANCLLQVAGSYANGKQANRKVG